MEEGIEYIVDNDIIIMDNGKYIILNLIINLLVIKLIIF